MKVIEFDGKGSGVALTENEIDPNKLNWIDVDINKIGDKNTLTNLVNTFQIPEFAKSSLMADNIRPRVVEYNNGLVIILRGVNSNPGREPHDMVSLRVWYTTNCIITFRKQKVKAVQDVFNALERGVGPKSSPEFLVMLTNSLINRIERVVSNKQEEIDDLDEILLVDDIKDLKKKIPEYRLDMIQLRRHLYPLRETFGQLIHMESYKFDNRTIRMLYESMNSLIRCIEDLDSARERCTIIQEQLNTKLNEQINKSIYSMSIVATIFLPLSLITGLLGINVGGIPGGHSNLAFSIVCVILVIVAIIQYIIFKRKMFL